MDKPINNRAWFLVVPVVAIVAFNAILPLMTVINYSVQDTFGNNQFFWNGVGWYQELLDPNAELGGRFLASLGRNIVFSLIVLVIEVPLGILVSLCMPKKGPGVAFCLVVMALPLLVPWNVVGTIWQIFARGDIGLLGWTVNHLGIDSRLDSVWLVPVPLEVVAGFPARYQNRKFARMRIERSARNGSVVEIQQSLRGGRVIGGEGERAAQRIVLAGKGLEKFLTLRVHFGLLQIGQAGPRLRVKVGGDLRLRPAEQ